MQGSVLYENYKEGYSVIRLDRPQKHNAISFEMVEDFKNCIQQAKEDEIKCLVITGTGDRMFCSGGDLENLHGDLTIEQAFSALYPMKEILYEIVSFPVPTVCLLNGSALGGGCEIATACDFRIAKEESTFGFVQSNMGIVPGWGGGVLLYEKVHSNFAYQWLTMGEIYDSSYLEKVGWLHKIIPNRDWDVPEKLLISFLKKSYEQMKVLKDQYKKKIAVLSLSAQMSEEVRQCANLWETKEHKEAVERFMMRK